MTHSIFVHGGLESTNNNITFFKRTQNISEMLRALSHEVGHNMGAKHDEKTKHCNTTSNYLMSQRLHYISTLAISTPDSSSEF